MAVGHKNPFTRDEESYLVKFLAKYKPTGQGRSGATVYKWLCEDPDRKWKWSRTHTWQSWRNQYVKNSHYYDKRIKKYQDSHGIDPTVSNPLNLPKKSPKSQKQRMREEQARKRKRQEEAEEEEESTSSEEDTRRMKRLKHGQEARRAISVDDSEGEDSRRKEIPSPRPIVDSSKPKVVNGAPTRRQPPGRPEYVEETATESEEEARAPVASDDYGGDIFGTRDEEDDEEDAAEEEEELIEQEEDDVNEEEDQEAEEEDTSAAEDEDEQTAGEGREYNDSQEQEELKEATAEVAEAEDQEAQGELDEVEKLLSPEQDNIALPEDADDVPRTSTTPASSESDEAEDDRIYPDIKKLPAPHFVKPATISQMPPSPFPGSFPASTPTPAPPMLAEGPMASGSGVRLDSARHSPPQHQVAKPKPKLKPKKTEEKFFDSNPGTPQPEFALDSKKARLPQLLSGPFRTAFQKPGQSQRSDSDAEEGAVWPPRRVVSGGNAAVADKGKQKENVATTSSNQSAPAPQSNLQQPPHTSGSFGAKPFLSAPATAKTAVERPAPLSTRHDAGNPQPTSSEGGDRVEYIYSPEAKSLVPKPTMEYMRKLYRLPPAEPLEADPHIAALLESAKGHRQRQQREQEAYSQQNPFRYKQTSTSTPVSTLQTQKPSAPSTSEDPFVTRSLHKKRKASGPQPHPEQPAYTLANMFQDTDHADDSGEKPVTPSSRLEPPGPYIDFREISRGSIKRSRSAPDHSSPAMDVSFSTPAHDQSFVLYSSAEKPHQPPPVSPKDEQPTPVLSPKVEEKHVEDKLNRRTSMLPFQVPEKDSMIFEYVGAQATLQNLAKKYGHRDEIVDRAYQHFRDLEKTETYCRRLREKTELIAEQLADEMEKEEKVEDVVMEEPSKPLPRKPTLAIEDGRRSSVSPEPPSSSPPRKTVKEKQLEIKPLPTGDEVSEYAPPFASRAGQFDRLVKQGRRDEALRREGRRASGLLHAPPLVEMGTPTLTVDSPTPQTRPPHAGDQRVNHARKVSARSIPSQTVQSEEEQQTKEEVEEDNNFPRRSMTREEQEAFLCPDRRSIKELKDIEARTDPDYLMSWIADGLSEFRA